MVKECIDDSKSMFYGIRNVEINVDVFADVFSIQCLLSLFVLIVV